MYVHNFLGIQQWDSAALFAICKHHRLNVINYHAWNNVMDWCAVVTELAAEYLALCEDRLDFECQQIIKKVLSRANTVSEERILINF